MPNELDRQGQSPATVDATVVDNTINDIESISQKCFPINDDFASSYFAGFGKQPKDITLVVTENCQLRCTYCYETGKNNKHDMTWETGKRIIDFLFEQDAANSKLINPQDADCLILEFIGGEPLLKIKLIDRLMRYFLLKAIKLNHRWRYKYLMSFSTNGVAFFNPEVQKFLKTWRGKVSMGVTLDGNKELHDKCRLFVNGKGSFDIAQKAFVESIRLGLSNATKLTIAPNNLPYLYDAVTEMITKYDIKHLAANPIFEWEWTVSEGKLFYEQLKKIGQWLLDTKLYKKCGFSILSNERVGEPLTEQDNQNWCGGTGRMLAFDYKGDIYPCLRYVPFTLTYKHDEKYTLGNVYTGILKTPEEQQRMKCLDCITRFSQSLPKCWTCPIASGCAWCSAWNYDKLGTPNKRFTGICNMHQARTLAYVWFWNKMYRQEHLPLRKHLYMPDDWALQFVSPEELAEIKKTEEPSLKDTCRLEPYLYQSDEHKNWIKGFSKFCKELNKDK